MQQSKSRVRRRALITAAALTVSILAMASPATADVIVGANSASFGSGPISSFDFTTSTLAGSFIPTGAVTCPGGGCNGRGLALTADRYFYTELGGGGFGATDAIHIAPYNGGLGGADIGTFANPIPGDGIQALAFGGSGNLYVLTGYPSTTPTVYILDGVTGITVGGPIVLQGADPGQDGFTVLPDGSFLGNLGDADNNYTHWSSSGVNLGGNFSAPSNGAGGLCGSATGVDIAPDGNSLYFMCNFSEIVHTDLNGIFLSSMSAPGGGWEDIAIQQEFDCAGDSCVSTNPPPSGIPEPLSFSLLGAGLIGVAMRRKAKKA